MPYEYYTFVDNFCSFWTKVDEVPTLLNIAGCREKKKEMDNHTVDLHASTWNWYRSLLLIIHLPKKDKQPFPISWQRGEVVLLSAWRGISSELMVSSTVFDDALREGGQRECYCHGLRLIYHNFLLCPCWQGFQHRLQQNCSCPCHQPLPHL